MNIRLIIGLLCVAFISYVSWCSYDYGYKKARTEQIDSYESMIQQLKADVGKALQRERIAYAKQEQIESNFLPNTRKSSTMRIALLMSIALTMLGCVSHSKPNNVPMCPQLPAAPAAIMQKQQADFSTQMSNFLFVKPQGQTKSQSN